MLVAVVSPTSKRGGNTTTSVLLALALSDYKRKIMLTHTAPSSPSFYQYFGMKKYEDKTSTPYQLVKLLRAGAVKPEELGDYCNPVNDYLDVFTNMDKEFNDKHMSTLLDFMSDTNNYDFTIIDVDSDYSSYSASIILERASIIIVNFASSVMDMSLFAEEREKYKKLFKGKKLLLVCNDYESTAGKLKDFSKKLGTKSAFTPIRHNSYLKWAFNTGKVWDLWKKSKVGDYRVVEISKDASALARLVTKARINILKKKKR